MGREELCHRDTIPLEAGRMLLWPDVLPPGKQKAPDGLLGVRLSGVSHEGTRDKQSNTRMSEGQMA